MWPSKARHHDVPETNDTSPLHPTNPQHHQPLSSSQPAPASQTDQTAALLLTPSRRLLHALSSANPSAPAGSKPPASGALPQRRIVGQRTGPQLQPQTQQRGRKNGSS
ncbi:hypothetical protein MRX96_056546 [Rhipicephalus microplus]